MNKSSKSLAQFGLNKDEENERNPNELYTIEKEYTQKQDITDCFMPLRKFLECAYGVCYREKNKEPSDEQQKTK